jgi:hypothetical protein
MRRPRNGRNVRLPSRGWLICHSLRSIHRSRRWRRHGLDLRVQHDVSRPSAHLYLFPALIAGVGCSRRPIVQRWSAFGHTGSPMSRLLSG